MGVIVRGVSSEPPAVVLGAGEVAPDFDLPALIGGVKRRFHLGDNVTQTHVVLAFYPLNWESVSARQLVEYQAETDRFKRYNCQVVGVSVDSIMNTTVWEREIGPFDFALCSDFWPHGQVSRDYGVFRADGVHAGTSRRAVFVIKQGGRIAFSKVYNPREVPPLAETLAALQGL